MRIVLFLLFLSLSQAKAQAVERCRRTGKSSRGG